MRFKHPHDVFQPHRTPHRLRAAGHIAIRWIKCCSMWDLDSGVCPRIEEANKANGSSGLAGWRCSMCSWRAGGSVGSVILSLKGGWKYIYQEGKVAGESMPGRLYLCNDQIQLTAPSSAEPPIYFIGIYSPPETMPPAPSELSILTQPS